MNCPVPKFGDFMHQQQIKTISLFVIRNTSWKGETISIENIKKQTETCIFSLINK